MPFARYHLVKSNRDKRARKGSRTPDRSRARHRAVSAHLCEVSHLETPQESNRKPTWFSPEKATRRLLEDRNVEFGAELAGVVERAVARISRLESRTRKEGRKDALQKVRFEAFENLHLRGGGNDAALIRYFVLEQRGVRSASVEVAEQSAVHRVLQLGTGTNPAADTAAKITAIDAGRETTSPAVKAGRRRAQQT